MARRGRRAAAEASEPARKLLQETRESVEHRLTDVDVIDRADELALVIEKIGIKEAAAAQVKADLKVEIQKLEGRRQELARVLRNRKEYRQVVCHQYLEGPYAVTYRTDTGEELNRRDATDDERQGKLGFKKDPTPANGSEPAESSAGEAESPAQDADATVEPDTGGAFFGDDDWPSDEARA